MKKIIFLFYTLFSCMLLQAQIHGVVKDKDGNTIPGVNVRWINEPIGVATDLQGHFAIEKSANVDMLVFSNVAYQNDTVTVKNQDQSVELNVTLNDILQLNQVEITARGMSVIKSRTSAFNIETITAKELTKAACCNLSESFETNASVDVSYDDAATGAKQIKLLGLSGKYVQMLTENIPNLRGLSTPYGLDYVPGTWMESIQVSKGTASVKNGYEAISGQINIEYKKPKTTKLIETNLYGNSVGRVEANAASGVKINDNLYMGTLLHASNNFMKIDENKDGYMDITNNRQYNLANRWHYEKGNYIMQAMLKGMSEKRKGGKIDDSYKVGINTERYELFLKNGFVFGENDTEAEHDHANMSDEEDEIYHTNSKKPSSLGLILNATIHNQDARYGLKKYDAKQNNFYANLIYDMQFADKHKLSVGTSFNADVYKENLTLDALSSYNRDEYTPGVFAEYTYTHKSLTAMGGLRLDHNSLYGTYVLPRFHLRYSIKDYTHLRLSLGRGFRGTNVLAENNFYLASSRKIFLKNNPKQAEDGWNYGITIHQFIPIKNKELSLMAEWFYTDFQHQVVTDLDSNPHEVHFTDLAGKSYSNSFQIEANMEIFKNFTATLAHRINDVKTTIGGVLREKPLTNRSKSLLTMSYVTPNQGWQFDFTTQLNGGGRMPDPDESNPLWSSTFKPFTILNGQITKNVKDLSIYCGVENMTGYTQKSPIIDVQNPFGNNFDATMVWGPLHGRTIYLGLRWALDKK